MAGRLIVASTPIGNARDASSRLVDSLRSATIIAAEDTRRLARLLRDLDVRVDASIISYHEHNEGRRTSEVIDALRDGATVVVVSDAGTPSVSDPGFRLVSAAIEAGVDVSAVPGPAAAVTALVISGLPVDRFCFEGFLPRKHGQRLVRLRELTDEPRTMVFYEAPHRVAQVLTDMAETWGADRPAAVCRELTKTHEEVRRGTLAELADHAEDVRGEVTLVVSGATGEAVLTDDEMRDRVRELVHDGLSKRDAVNVVAKSTGVSRKKVYDLAHG